MVRFSTRGTLSYDSGRYHPLSLQHPNRVAPQSTATCNCHAVSYGSFVALGPHPPHPRFFSLGLPRQEFI